MGKKKKKKANLLREMQQLGEADRQQPQSELSASHKRLQGRAPKGVKVVMPGPDALKMSAVIQDFVEPYFEKLGDFHQCSSFLALAVEAWNTAILPEDERADEITFFLEESKPNHDPIEIHGVRQLIEDLVEDKLESFAEFDRMVIDYDFYVAEDGEWRLSVVSQHPEIEEDAEESVDAGDVELQADTIGLTEA